MVEKILYGEDARQYFRNFLQMNQVDRNNISVLLTKAKDEKKSNRYDYITAVGGTLYVTLVALGIVSNPVGWVVGIGTGLYFEGRLIYDLATEP